MALQDDRTFVRHFSWVILFLAVMLIIFIILSFVIVGVTGVESHSGYSYVQYMNQHQAAAPAATASGHVQAATAQGGESGQKVAVNETAQAASGTSGAEGSAGSIDGKSVWEAHCSVCHATGVAGAPKIGDQADWAKIFKTTNQATLYKHAIDGFQGDRGFMPPKGGAAGLSDAQVKAAVDYMIEKSGWSAH